ncbi:hypothetical protein BS17DRAFT_316611 [Gyrodon lividus]|nr:hypothetical protein BS17DRAFT_316611 [Gyrodon lividus]
MQYQRTHSTSSMAPSERSISSGSSAASPPHTLVALPSMTHSLAALPTMSSLPSDMVHHNSGAHSRARMEYALQKQRQQGATNSSYAALNAYDVRRSPSPGLGEDSRITVRRQQNTREHNVSCLFALTENHGPELMTTTAVVSHATVDDRLVPAPTSALSASDVADMFLGLYYLYLRS